MSPKELMYIEDALGQQKTCMEQCQHAAQTLQDPELRQLAQQMMNKTQQMFQQFYQLV